MTTIENQLLEQKKRKKKESKERKKERKTERKQKLFFIQGRLHESAGEMFFDRKSKGFRFLSILLSFLSFVCLSSCLFEYLSVYRFIVPSVYQSMFLDRKSKDYLLHKVTECITWSFFRPSLYLSVCVSVCLSVCLLACLFVCRSIYPSIYFFLSAIYVYLPICLSA